MPYDSFCYGAGIEPRKWSTESKEALETKIEAVESKKKKIEGVGTDDVSKINGDKVVVAQIPHTKGKIQAIAWGPNQDDTRLGCVDQAGACFVWETTKKKRMYGCVSTFAQCMAISQDQENPMMLVGGMRNATVLYKKDPDSAIMKESKTWILHDGYISSLHFLDNGKRYISSSGDANICIFDISAAATEVVCTMRGHTKDAQSIKFAKDDKAKNTFITCSSDKTVKMWDIRSATCVATFESESELNSCCIFPDGKLIAAGGEKDKTFVFDVRAMKQVGKYARNNMKTASCEFSRSGRELYIGHDDGALIVWDMFGSGENKNYVKKIEAHTTYDGAKKVDITASRVCAMEISPAGYLTTGGFDGKVNIWGAKPE